MPLPTPSKKKRPSKLCLATLQDCSLDEICERWNSRGQSADDIVQILHHPQLSAVWLIFYRWRS